MNRKYSSLLRKKRFPPKNCRPKIVSPSKNVSPPKNLSHPKKVFHSKNKSPLKKVSLLKNACPPKKLFHPKIVFSKKSSTPKNGSSPKIVSSSKKVSPPTTCFTWKIWLTRKSVWGDATSMCRFRIFKTTFFEKCT